MEDMAAYAHPPDPIHNPHYPYYPSQAPPPPVAAPPPLPIPPQHHHHHHHLPPPQYHQHQHQHQQQQPVFPSYAPPPPPLYPSQDEVRTLFIAGLPDDVKPREIYNLFREFPGYQTSQLRSTGQSSQAFAFAVFSDQQSAVAAMHALNGLMFDLEKESTLYIDMAKSNSRSKRSRSDDGRARFSDKKVRGSGAFSRGLPDSGVGSNIHLPGMGNSAYNMNGYPSAQSQGNFDIETGNDINLKKFSNNSSTPYVPQNNNPCPTLFVANLGPNCTEQGLTQIFSRCPGFLKLKMQNKRGVPVAFIDFQDVASSTGALCFLQGSPQFSLDGDGMRLEYAKTRMGLRKRERRP